MKFYVSVSPLQEKKLQTSSPIREIATGQVQPEKDEDNHSKKAEVDEKVITLNVRKDKNENIEDNISFLMAVKSMLWSAVRRIKHEKGKFETMSFECFTLQVQHIQSVLQLIYCIFRGHKLKHLAYGFDYTLAGSD